MTSLGETVAALARSRRPSSASTQAGGRLQAVADFGPNPGALRMLQHVPPGLGRSAPLVVVLHGCTQTAEAYAAGAGWLALADRYGFAVLCPEQVRANNPNLCFNWFEPSDTTRGGGEAASIAQMVRYAVAEHGLDASRVFVTGLSAGGAMTAAMLATYPDLFAGGAPVAGLAYGAASNMQEAFGAMFSGVVRSGPVWGDHVRRAYSHAGPWPPLSIWHGEADSTVKPGAAQELARQWVDVHGIADRPVETVSPNGRRTLSWRDPAGRVRVELHLLPGMGHGAALSAAGPDGCGTAGPFLIETGISSSLEIARFWGLAPAQALRRADPRSAERPQRSQTPEASRPQAGTARAPVQAKGGPGEVIAAALRAAGLLR